MKKALIRVMALLLISGTAAVNAGQHTTNTIVDVAQSAGSFKTLVQALKAADLVTTLQSEGPFTVFAPTDEAFAALPEGALAALLENPEQLAQVLTLHVVAGEVPAAKVVDLASVTTVQGSALDVDTESGVSIGGAKVVKTDIDASNGVIHVIDRVILPQS